jgi:TRAP-type C4-dicarboxylate transport system permease large subunit
VLGQVKVADMPMFVLLGLLMEMAGIAGAMVAFFAALVGHVRGGLSYVLPGRCIWCPASRA